jgi:hypothetical protein
VSQITNGYLLSTGDQNAEVNWDVTLAAGTWSVNFMHVTHFDLGIYSIQFDSVEKGTVDGYKATPAVYNVVSTISGISVPVTKKIEFKLKMATKNVNATLYRGLISCVTLIRTA